MKQNTQSCLKMKKNTQSCLKMKENTQYYENKGKYTVLSENEAIHCECGNCKKVCFPSYLLVSQSTMIWTDLHCILCFRVYHQWNVHLCVFIELYPIWIHILSCVFICVAFVVKGNHQIEICLCW
jgi:hypothetical protein